MTTEDFIKQHPLAAFGEGDAKHGYAQADNWEDSKRKLRHAFWKGAAFAPVQGTPGLYLAKLAGGAERVVYGK